MDDPYAQADAAASQIDKEFVQINQQFSDLNLQYQQQQQQQQQSSMPPPSLDYGVNSYGSGPQSGSEMNSMQNYGESDTVTDAYQQQSHYDEQQQQHQYHSNYYQSGVNDLQQYGDQPQSQLYQPQSIDSNSPLSYEDTANYLNSEVIFYFLHFCLYSHSMMFKSKSSSFKFKFYF